MKTRAVTLRALYGPSLLYDDHDRIVWQFKGITESGSARWWKLTYTVETRRFSALRMPMTSQRKALARNDLQLQLGDSQRFNGAGITALLRSRLSEADLANCTRRSILRRPR